jgi:hypothetical protein
VGSHQIHHERSASGRLLALWLTNSAHHQALLAEYSWRGAGGPTQVRHGNGLVDSWSYNDSLFPTSVSTQLEAAAAGYAPAVTSWTWENNLLSGLERAQAGGVSTQLFGRDALQPTIRWNYTAAKPTTAPTTGCCSSATSPW